MKTEEEERICKLLVEILVNRLERPVMQLLGDTGKGLVQHSLGTPDTPDCALLRQDDVMKMPLYPTEELIWDPNLVPEEHYSGKTLGRLQEMSSAPFALRR